MAHALCRVGLAPLRCLNRRGKEEFQLKHPARSGQILIRCDPTDRRLMHSDGIGDGFQVQGPQVFNTKRQEPVLLPDDL